MLFINDRLNISQKYISLVWTEKTMLPENGDVITIDTTGCQTTRPWVSKMAGRRYHVASLLIGMISSLLTPSQAHLTQLKRQKETRYFKASDLASLGKSEDKTTLSKPAPCFRFWLLCSCSWHRLEGKYQRILNHNKTQKQRIKNGANFAGRYIEMRMRRVHLRMRTEGIEAFSKRIRRCSADGRRRYKNDVWTEIFLKTEQSSSVFV